MYTLTPADVTSQSDIRIEAEFGNLQLKFTVLTVEKLMSEAIGHGRFFF